jgi:hypothetical protein
LLAVKHVGDDNEAVAPEDLHRVVGLGRCKNLKPADTGAGIEVGLESGDLWIVLPAVNRVWCARFNQHAPPERRTGSIITTVSTA